MVYLVFADRWPYPYGVDIAMLFASKSVTKADEFASQMEIEHPDWDVWVTEQGLDVSETNPVYTYIE